MEASRVLLQAGVSAALLLWSACAHNRDRDETVEAAKRTESPVTADADTKAEAPSPSSGVPRTPSGQPPPPTSEGGSRDTPAAPGERDHALYDGRTGAPVQLDAFVRSVADADLIAFGEFHRHAVGSRLERELLAALIRQKRPLALAMEFFERDTQEFVDRYLAGEIPEEKFVSWSRQSKGYAQSHRPLIELCKKHGVPVIAANAPRRLATEYRKSQYDYKEFLETLSDEERDCLPDETTDLSERHRGRFMKLMGGHGTPANARFTRTMALWDDSMADAIARFRARSPGHRVLLVVGSFHIMEKLGTIRKYGLRRPDDRVRTLVMNARSSLEFDPGDRGIGDAVLTVRSAVAPKKPQSSKGPRD